MFINEHLQTNYIKYNTNEIKPTLGYEVNGLSYLIIEVHLLPKLSQCY